MRLCHPATAGAAARERPPSWSDVVKAVTIAEVWRRSGTSREGGHGSVAMPAGLKRQLEGGRAADWAWRREQRGAGGLPQAPSWSAEAADAFLVTLNVCHKDDGSKSIGVQLLMVLQDGDASDRLMAALPSGTSASARRLIAQIVFHQIVSVGPEGSEGTCSYSAKALITCSNALSAAGPFTFQRHTLR